MSNYGNQWQQQYSPGHGGQQLGFSRASTSGQESSPYISTTLGVVPAGQQFISQPMINEPFGFNDQFYGDDLYDLYSSISPDSLATPFADPYHCPFFQDYTPNRTFRSQPMASYPVEGGSELEAPAAGPSQETGSASDTYCSEDSTRGERRKKKRYPCPEPDCGPEVVFTRSTDLRRHQDSKHGRKRDFPCPVRNCERVGERAFARKDHLVEHLRQYHGIAVKKREPGQRRGPGIPPV